MASLRMFVRDDQGWAWTIDDGQLIAVLDLISGVRSGIPCKDWNEAVALLNKQGHITGETEILDPVDTPPAMDEPL
jgi:hypothetical protein